LLSPFMRQGWSAMEKVLYIVDDHTGGQIWTILAQTVVEVNPYLRGDYLAGLSSGLILHACRRIRTGAH